MNAPFREPTEEDLGQVLTFMRALSTEDGSTPLVPDRAAEALHELLHDQERGRIWLIEVSQMAAGYLVVTWGFSLEFHGRDAFIDELYVAPPYRGAGLGRQAMELAERECRAQGVRALHLEVEPGNERAQSLYRHRGFAQRGYHLMTKRLAE
ncbi:MAG: GNAT family N-acetyltransferase [Gemmatimonadales bacterium]